MSDVSDPGAAAAASVGEAAGEQATVGVSAEQDRRGEQVDADSAERVADVPVQGGAHQGGVEAKPSVTIRDFAYAQGDPRYDGIHKPAVGDDWPDDETIKVRALFDYTGETETELSFSQNDIITVTESCGNGWLAAISADGKHGFVPESYVARVEDDGQ